jgi:hypothetical protein
VEPLTRLFATNNDQCLLQKRVLWRGEIGVSHTPLFAHATGFALRWRREAFVANAILNCLLVVACLVGSERVIAITLGGEGICGLERVDSSLYGRLDD